MEPVVGMRATNRARPVVVSRDQRTAGSIVSSETAPSADLELAVSRHGGTQRKSTWSQYDILDTHSQHARD